MRIPGILRRIRAVGAILIAAAVLGAAVPAKSGFAQNTGPTPGTARIWIYRIFDPSITLATPYVRINGAIVAVAQLGRAFYRDVPPGNYLITVDSAGWDVNQFARMALAAGADRVCQGRCQQLVGRDVPGLPNEHVLYLADGPGVGPGRNGGPTGHRRLRDRPPFSGRAKAGRVARAGFEQSLAATRFLPEDGSSEHPTPRSEND
jgi:hypothetical protein